MGMSTKVTLLIPSKKTYCDYAMKLEDTGGNTATGQWWVIDYLATPVRQGYLKFNSFGKSQGDAFLEKGLYPGYHLYLMRFGYLNDPILRALFNGAFAHVVMDDKNHMFTPGKETWAKKANLTPQMEEIIAIFWS